MQLGSNGLGGQPTLEALLEVALHVGRVLGLPQYLQQVVAGQEVEAGELLPLGLQVVLQGLLDAVQLGVQVLKGREEWRGLNGWGFGWVGAWWGMWGMSVTCCNVDNGGRVDRPEACDQELYASSHMACAGQAWGHCSHGKHVQQRWALHMFLMSCTCCRAHPRCLPPHLEVLQKAWCGTGRQRVDGGRQRAHAAHEGGVHCVKQLALCGQLPPDVLRANEDVLQVHPAPLHLWGEPGWQVAAGWVSEHACVSC